MIPGNGFARVAVNFNLANSQLGQNIFDFAYEVTSPGDADDFLDALLTWVEGVYGHVDGQVTDDVAIESVTAWDINPGDGDLTLIGEIASTFVGTSTQDTLPAGVAKLIRLYTEDPDVIGRKYVPGITELANDGTGLLTANSILSAFAAFAAAAATAYAVGDVQLTPGVFSLTKLAFSQFNGNNFNPSNPGYQRRRRLNVGA